MDEFEKQLALEREWEARALQVQAKAAQAYLRLVELAERSDTGQARRVARFLASTFNGERYPFDLFELRVLDVALSDDALVCIDALRWGKADLYKLLGMQFVPPELREDWGEIEAALAKLPSWERKGDRITKIGVTDVRNVEDLMLVLGEAVPGQKVTVVYLRAGAEARCPACRVYLTAPKRAARRAGRAPMV